MEDLACKVVVCHDQEPHSQAAANHGRMYMFYSRIFDKVVRAPEPCNAPLLWSAYVLWIDIIVYLIPWDLQFFLGIVRRVRFPPPTVVQL